MSGADVRALPIEHYADGGHPPGVIHPTWPHRGLRVYIVGQRHSGKDTAARLLSNSFNYDIWRTERLTDPVYALARASGMKDKDRRLLQESGDFLRESLGQDSLALHLVLRCLAPGNYVCPDIRLPREAEILRRAGWLGVRVNRSEDDRRASLVAVGEDPDGPEASHHTETLVQQVPVDFAIQNDGNIDHLRRVLMAGLRDAIEARRSDGQ